MWYLDNVTHLLQMKTKPDLWVTYNITTRPSIMCSLLHRLSTCVCVRVVLQCWGVEGLRGQLQSPFRGPLGLFTTDPSVTDNHLPPMSIAHKCLCSSSLCSHQSSSTLRLCSVQSLAADVACTQQEKQRLHIPRTGCISFIATGLRPHHTMQFYVAFKLFKGDVLCSTS